MKSSAQLQNSLQLAILAWIAQTVPEFDRELKKGIPMNDRMLMDNHEVAYRMSQAAMPVLELAQRSSRIKVS